MSTLKENEEKRSRKEERENQQQQQRLATPSLVCHVDKSVDNRRRANIMHHAWERGITRNDLEDAAENIGMSAAEVNEWLEYMETIGWRMSNGYPVNGCNFRRPLRMWHKIEERIKARRERRGGSAEREAEKRRAAEVERMRKMYEDSKKPASWTLCNERCAFAEVCGCAKKHLIPPQLRSYPIPPQDCDGFEPKEVA